MRLHSLHSWNLTVPQSIYNIPKPACSGYCYSSMTNRSGIRSWGFGFRLVHQSTGFESCNSKGRGLKRFCTANFDEVSNDELSKQIEEFTENFSFCEDEHDSSNSKESSYAVSDAGNVLEGMNSRNMCSSTPFSVLNVEMLEPSLLGIKPEPPEWPERDEIVRIGIERKANCGDIPLSLRIIKKKRQWQEGFVDAGEFAYCSVKKAFSSMVFIIRELQTYALDIRQSLYCEDLQVIMFKVQREMNASFVWLFQQVFSRTPTLMVYVMILLANFTVHSMADNIVIAAVPSPKMLSSGTVSLLEQTNQESTLNSAVSLLDISDVGLVGNQGMALEEVRLWKSIVEAASRIQGESRFKNFDHETIKNLVSPVTVEIEPDDYEEYSRMDLLYQMSVAEEPNNPLLLTNYGQFLHLVAHDHDRAEECFKRAILLEPPDADALSLYADFLWVVRKDLCAAEERYQQAIEADPNSPHYISKYAYFLWGTGNKETCFPEVM
ncbi:hypothetical protein HS088_TW13G01363 [Tripterygium wilfordii]|uniref:Tetratricopeptide repeat-like superfamily protein n=1 Tax=Tripterygium wilfordii TaxID=458696 RepID=A0A7J7CWR6_TRIWF|nr:uncharacterized protein LOC120011811 [Tripterygium wilfordii]XP_038718863.1 uncharacterized protein LOC120011811 [Tripterygium wilfordii]KAF5738464.1 hypothetical protein HS088_TW13G01363 [Tripterygium wilfordii]